MSNRVIAFAICSLSGGGAERALCNVLKNLQPRLGDRTVHLILFDTVEEIYEVPSYVIKHTLDCKGSYIKSIIGLYGLLRRINPDVCVGYMMRANCALILCSLLLKFRCIISERIYTPVFLKNRPIDRIFVKSLYRMAHTVISVSRGVRQGLVGHYSVRPQRIKTIYNIVDCDEIERKGRENPPLELPSSFIICVGRLVSAKKFDTVIEAYARSHTSHDLVIIGEGPERANLQQLIEDLGLQNRVWLPGFVSNPFSVISRAQFYLSASTNEGFPNALIEAMALGCPVVATDCWAGPAEILADKVKANQKDILAAEFGILVPEEEMDQLAQAINMMSERDVRERYSRKALERAGHFAKNDVIGQYLAVIS